MALQSSLKVALKEWAIVSRAMETGSQLVLLRKGGIHESGGEFELEHPQFLFFPTYLHQNAEMLKPGIRPELDRRTSEPDQITIGAAGVVTDIVKLNSRSQINAIDDEHIWSEPLIEMRFNYKPQNPLYLLLIRAYRLATAVTVANTPAYAGCKSWVPLDEPITTAGAVPAIEDASFATRRDRILSRVQSSR